MVKEEWSGKKISVNHPSQAQGFGIGDMLTAGTLDGEVTSNEDSNSGSSTSGSTSKEPWTLVTKNKQGNQLKPAEYHEERESTDLTSKGGATRDKVINKKITVPRPTCNQVTLGIRGEEEEKYMVTQPPKTYFSKAAPTGATYAKCLGQARAPLGATRGARLMARKREFKKHQNSGPTPAEASGHKRRATELKRDGAKRGGGPTLDATKHEGVTGSPTDTRSGRPSG